MRMNERIEKGLRRDRPMTTISIRAHGTGNGQGALASMAPDDRG